MVPARDMSSIFWPVHDWLLVISLLSTIFGGIKWRFLSAKNGPKSSYKGTLLKVSLALNISETELEKPLYKSLKVHFEITAGLRWTSRCQASLQFKPRSKNSVKEEIPSSVFRMNELKGICKWMRCQIKTTTWSRQT